MKCHWSGYVISHTQLPLWYGNSFYFILFLQGLDISEKGLDLVSHVITKLLNIECAVLMGANIAPEVAKEDFCEATIGKN